MRILQLIYESFGSPYGFGGAGVRAYEIYKRLRNRHDITLLCMRYPGAKDGEIEGLYHLFTGTESGNLTKTVISYTFRAMNYVRTNGRNFDVIVENFLPATPFFSKFLTRTPVILQLQGIMGRHAMKKFSPVIGLPMYIMEKIYPRIYDRYIFVADVNSEKFKTGSDRYRIIPNGISRELLVDGDNDDDNYILFFSRIDIYTKGLDVLVDAFVRLAQRHKEIRLVLAGYEFDDVSILRERLPAGMRNRFVYAGFVTGEEKRRLLSRAKVYVLPSRHEAHPVSILEALACGTAVVASDIPELRYIETQGLGLTFRNGSSEDLSEKINELLGNTALRNKLGDEGRRYASSFLWDDISIMFEEFLHETVRTPGE
jgi:glycosyltransferase involved in cell wall biosynthesis